MYILLIVKLFMINILLTNGNIIDNDIKKIPDYLKVCHRKDPKLNDCVKESIENLREKLADGILDLQIPPCEPLEIPKITISQNAGAISMNSEYSNIFIYGLSNFTLRSVRIDPEKNKFRLKLWFSELKMTGEYQIHGKILMMPLTGHGNCSGNFSDIDAVASMKADRVFNNNREYLKVNDLFVEFNMGNANVHLENLFNGDSELSTTMNTFLNENWRSVAAEVRPALEDTISNILRGIAEKMFNSFTLEQLLPE